jgi:pyruvate formate lyase activating enzyme
VLVSGVAYECRTTWNTGLYGKDDLQALAGALAAEGVRHWALQECRTEGAPAWAAPQRIAQHWPGTLTVRRA